MSGSRVAAGTLLVLAAAGVQATPERLAEGQRVYEEACARCHASGAEGAPRVGDGEAWKGRSMLWEAVLFEHADKGWLAMPARGGDPVLDSADVEVAAEYMLHLTFPSMPGD